MGNSHFFRCLSKNVNFFMVTKKLDIFRKADEKIN